MKLTAKQEKFAQEWYATGNKSRAYRFAYDAENMSDVVINNEAVIVSQNHAVAMRFEELQADLMQRTRMSVETVNDMLMEGFKIAKEDANAGAVIQAANSISKLHGLDRLSAAQIKKIEKEIESSNNMDTEVQPLNITFEVSEAVSEVKVTQGK